MSKWSAAFRDSRWQKLRLEVMERDNWTCRSCGKGKDDGITLNVHHAYYEAGKAPWEYPKQTLVTFCEECHTERHALQKLLLVKMSTISTTAISGLIVSAMDFPETIEQLLVSHETGLSDEHVSRMLGMMMSIYVSGETDSKENAVVK